jgi:hypothetical protein
MLTSIDPKFGVMLYQHPVQIHHWMGLPHYSNVCFYSARIKKDLISLVRIQTILDSGKDE